MTTKEILNDERWKAYDWRFDNPISTYGNFYAFLFYFISDEAVKRFGVGGSKAVADGMTRYGNFRGALLRTRQVKMGLDINVESFDTVYDLPRDDRTNAKQFMLTKTGYYTEFYTCQFSDIWKMLEGIPFTENTKIGRLYCDYFHPAMWDGYCLGMRLELPKIKTSIDDYCIFYCSLDSTADTNPAHGLVPEADMVNWNFEEPVSAMSNIYCLMYYFLADGIIRHFGKDGEEAVAAGLKRYGDLRGNMLAQTHKEKGLEINVKNFFDYYDLPSDPRTKNENITLTETEGLTKTCACHMSDIWKTLEKVPKDTGVSNIGSIYCRNFHPAMWEGYCSNMHVDLSEAMTYGDSGCTFKTYMN